MYMRCKYVPSLYTDTQEKMQQQATKNDLPGLLQGFTDNTSRITQTAKPCTRYQEFW